MMNNGEKAWDRLYNVRDGLSMKLKFGNFNIEPFYGKIARGDSITRSTNVEDYGFSFLYDNLESDFAIGLLMQKRSAIQLQHSFLLIQIMTEHLNIL